MQSNNFLVGHELTGTQVGKIGTTFRKQSGLKIQVAKILLLVFFHTVNMFLKQ